MDMEEIRYLLGSTIFARAKAYLDRVDDLDCETSENGVRHLTAMCAAADETVTIHRPGCGKTEVL